MDESMIEYTSRFHAALESAQRNVRDAIMSQVDLGLTGPQYFMLYMIHKEGEMKQTHLAEKLGVKPSAITVMIDKLVQNGFAVRSHDEKDRRVVHVRLTESGQHMVTKLESIRNDVVGRMLSVLSSDELEMFIRTFEKLAAIR